MKKIERYQCLGVAVIDGTDRGLTKYWAVLKSDLDQLERDIEETIEALREHVIHYEKVTSLKPIKTVSILERLTGQEWQELKEIK